MGINIRAKGAGGEQEVARALNPIVVKLLTEGGYPVPEKPVIQRNQNQSAVGGSDLSNTFGLAVEIKRQEQLSINTWWAQCVTSAKEANEHPVLLYRQNGKKWKCVTNAWLELPMQGYMIVRAEMDWDTFLRWFEEWVRRKLLSGSVPNL